MGTVASEWKKADGKIVYTFTVPEGSTATAYLPDGEHVLECGINEIIV